MYACAYTCSCVCVCACACESVFVCVCVCICVIINYCFFLLSVETILENIATRISGLVVALDSKVDLFRQKVESDHQSLRETLDTLNDSVSNLSVCLQEHKEQTTAELAHLQTSLNSTNSKLNSLDRKVVALDSKVVALDSKVVAVDSKVVALDSTVVALGSKVVALDSKVVALDSKVDLFMQEVESDHQSLRETLDTLNDSVSNRSVCFQEHKEQTTVELAHLQTSVNSTNSKLNSLTATATQLSFDHQEIQTNITDVECADTEQNVQFHQNLHDKLTNQLEKIQNDVTFIREQYSCGGTVGWRRVVYLDMTDPHTTCPSGWNMTEMCQRTCGRKSTGSRTCSSATFPVIGGEYSRVCGRIRAYQWGQTLGFYNYHWGYVTTIDGAYASGVSLTRGTPRNHIWTFVAGASEGNPTWSHVCPCDATSTIRIPPFVGNDYFCESGINEGWVDSRHLTFHCNDTLWDGEDCFPSSTCCSQHNPLYFTKQLPTPTTDDIEARICLYYPLQYANLLVELVELYVQ